MDCGDKVLSINELNKVLTFLRYMSSKNGDIDESLRGWNWYKPPVEPPTHAVKLSVSEIAYRYCPTMRDLYLKRVMRVRMYPTPPMLEGRLYHEVIKKVALSAKKLIYGDFVRRGDELVIQLMSKAEDCVVNLINQVFKSQQDSEYLNNLKRKALRLWNFIALQIASRYDTLLSRYGISSKDSIAQLSIMYIVERIIDGSRIGLSNRLMIDAFEPGNVLIEFKTGREENFHKVALAGYALALESETNIPTDYGILIYIRLNSEPYPKLSTEPVLIDEELRREFIDLRDQAMAIVLNEKDPGIAYKCHPQCPYKDYCTG